MKIVLSSIHLHPRITFRLSKLALQRFQNAKALVTLVELVPQSEDVTQEVTQGYFRRAHWRLSTEKLVSASLRSLAQNRKEPISYSD